MSTSNSNASKTTINKSLPFTAHTIFRDTHKEREFAKQSIPSIIDLDPDEIVIGIDYPIKSDFLDFIFNICDQKEYPHSRIKIVEVSRSKDWNFHAGNVFYHSLQKSSNPHVYHFDVDTVTRKQVLYALKDLGLNNVAVVSFTKYLIQKTLAQKWRFLRYKRIIKKNDYVFSGCFWVYAPYYFEVVDKSEFQKVYNGFDSFMIYSINQKGKHKIITHKEFGVNCLDIENEFLEWRQYLDGIYYYCKRIHKVHAIYTQNIFLNKLRQIYSGLSLFRHILSETVFWWKPYFLKGAIFIMLNPNHPIIEMTKNSNKDEWFHLGSTPLNLIDGMREKWKKGTGYSSHVPTDISTDKN